MSFRRSPFQFNPDLNSDERRSELLRRFGIQPEEDNMFYETTNSPSWSEWPGRFHRPGFYEDPEWRNTGSIFGSTSGPGSPQTRMRRGWTSTSGSDPEEGVPIKVVHEQSGTTSRAGPYNDCDGASETSSQGSRSSSSSTRSVPGNGGGSSKNRQDHEPRVHHIPIMVEPRNGSASSGYASDSDPKHPAAQFSQQPGRSSFGSPKETEFKGEAKHVHTVPIRMESGDQVLARSKTDRESRMAGENGGNSGGWANTFPRQKCQQAPKSPPTIPSAKSTPGSKVTSPSSSMTSPGTSGSSVASPCPLSPERAMGSPEQQRRPNRSKPGPLELIRQVNLELMDLKQQVYSFSGVVGDKQFRYLDEMLTRLMLKLDLIDPAGQNEVRRLRKIAIHDVQCVINHLEGKAPPPGLIVELPSREMGEAEEDNGNNHDCADHNAANNTDMQRREFASFGETSSDCQSGCNLGATQDKSLLPQFGGGKETQMDVNDSAPEKSVGMGSVDAVAGSTGGGGIVDEQVVEMSEVPRPAKTPSPIDVDNGSMLQTAEDTDLGASTPVNEQSFPSKGDSTGFMDESESSTSLPTEQSSG